MWRQRRTVLRACLASGRKSRIERIGILRAHAHSHPGAVMEHRYIASLSGADDAGRAAADPTASALLDAGMQRLVSTDRVHVFAEPGTPARSLSERVVLIGHPFPNHSTQLGCLTSSRAAIGRAHV